MPNPHPRQAAAPVLPLMMAATAQESMYLDFMDLSPDK